MAGVISELCSNIVKDLWNTAVQYNIWFTITHLSRKSNTERYIASCFLNDKTEWEVSPFMFYCITHHHEVAPSINLFASCLKWKLLVYSSFGPNPFFSYVDAFTFVWSAFDCVYAYPPFNLLSRILAKIKRDKDTTISNLPMLAKQSMVHYDGVSTTWTYPHTHPLLDIPTPTKDLVPGISTP